jgi:hypothetical protein
MATRADRVLDLVEDGRGLREGRGKACLKGGDGECSEGDPEGLDALNELQ